jgi:PAS domain-containing protein
MIPSDIGADEILRKVVGVVKKADPAQLRALDSFPVAIYVTDIDGFITYFNPACIDFAGRTPTLNRDRWCVTWKLYTDAGDFLPHERCPMAVAIQTRRAVRGVTAVAERPNGIRIRFQPFPTPVVGDSGELLAAVNMLVEMTGDRGPAVRGRRDGARTSSIERVNQALKTFTVGDVQDLVDEIEAELDRRPPRLLN